MSTGSVNTAAGSPHLGHRARLGPGHESIISALLAVEREPVTRLTIQQEKLQGDQEALATIQSSLLQLDARGLRIQPALAV